MQWVLIIFALAVVLFLAVPRIQAMPVDEAAQLIRDGALLVDVRSDVEYGQQSVPGSVNMPLDQLADRIEAAGHPKDRPLLVFCRSGNRSSTAKKLLEQMGFTAVKNLGAFGNASKAAELARQQKAAAE